MSEEEDEFAVSGKREDIANLLRVHGSLNTVELSERADIPQGSRGYHLGQLADADIVEKVGEDRLESGNTAPVWTLTDAGERVAQEVDRRRISEQEVEELRETVAELHEELETVREEFGGKYETAADILDELLRENPDAARRVEERLDDGD